MRLSELLSKAPLKTEAQVERFLGRTADDADSEIEVAPGYHEMVDVGRVLVNFLCRKCDDSRTFSSGDRLSCLVVSERVVSIDAVLKCIGCDARVEAWFLVTSRNGLTAQAPIVRLVRYVDNRRDDVGRLGAQAGASDLNELLERAQVAHEHQLGLGSMVYLRIIFETLTKQAAVVAGVALSGSNGGRKSFKSILKEVDELRHIIPPAFSTDGYKLYSELSEIVHGNSTEAMALEKFKPCESLVLGVIRNIEGDHDMRRAVEDLGWAEVGAV